MNRINPMPVIIITPGYCRVTVRRPSWFNSGLVVDRGGRNVYVYKC